MYKNLNFRGRSQEERRKLLLALHELKLSSSILYRNLPISLRVCLTMSLVFLQVSIKFSKPDGIPCSIAFVCCQMRVFIEGRKSWRFPWKRERIKRALSFSIFCLILSVLIFSSSTLDTELLTVEISHYNSILHLFEDPFQLLITRLASNN